MRISMSRAIAMSAVGLVAAGVANLVVHQAPDLWKYLRAEGM